MGDEEIQTIMDLAADYKGCATKQVPVYEATNSYKGFSDRLSEFRKFLNKCQDIVLGHIIPDKKIPLIVRQLVKEPEQAYTLFKQIHPVK